MNDELKIPKGFKAAGVNAGIRKKKDRRDFALIVSDVPAVGAGTFTQNRFAAAPVEVCRRRVFAANLRAIAVNSGCANACTGKRGLKDAEAMAGAVARAIGCPEKTVLPCSTGVIGQFLPMDRVEAGAGLAKFELTATEEGWRNAAQAIMTTDTVPKIASTSLEIAGKTVSFLGIAKGSGMIHPNMATMLTFVVTDAAVEGDALKRAAKRAVDRSFNRVTVDGDTSTNDSAIILANGQAGNPPVKVRGRHYGIFEAALTDVCQQLARMIAMDGEGATKLIEVRVTGAKTEADAHRAASAVATSSLVKTAIFGRDANWGRIVCAIGNSGATFQPDKITVHMGPELIFAKGAPQVGDEEGLNRVLAGKEVPIIIDLGAGKASAVIWTCDLTYDYIKINADYRT